MANTSAPQQALRPVAVGVGSGLVGGAQILCVQTTESLALAIICGTLVAIPMRPLLVYANLPSTNHFQQPTRLNKPPL